MVDITTQDRAEAEKAGFLYDYRSRLFVTNRTLSYLRNKQEFDEVLERIDAESQAQKQKLTPKPVEKRKPVRAKKSRGTTPTVPVFSVEEMGKLLAKLKDEDSDRAKRQTPDLEAARTEDGHRSLFTQPLLKVVAGLNGLKSDMPNFTDVIDILIGELALAFSGKPEDFHVGAICMNGVPGIGKTRFAREVAKILDVGFEAISMGATCGGFELAGVPSGYSNSKSGRIFRLLAEGKSACPVVLLDEIDKLAGDERFSPLPILLDLLESDSAKKFRDEGLEARCDASRIIFLLTSNEARFIAGPLQSRMRMVEIQTPTSEQRREIATRIASEFKKVGVSFKDQMLDALCEVNMDLRALRRFLRDAAGWAISNGLKEIGCDDVMIPAKPVEKRIGFV